MQMEFTVSELMVSFLSSPLVVWVKTFGPLGDGSGDQLSMFMDLVDGIFLHKIMTQIDPSPSNHRVNKQVNNDTNLRIQNLSVVIKHIKSYYQENLQQLIVMNLPNVLIIGKDPLSDKSMEEMKRLLLLVLGCAVQCECKQEFIEKIKLLDIETQTAIVTHIQEVTHNQENVLDLHSLEVGELPAEELDPLSRSMAFHLRKLINERDEYTQLIVELTQERDYLLSQQPSHTVQNPSQEQQVQGGPVSALSKEERQHLEVELADNKAMLRRARHELEEKTEQLMDSKNEIDKLDLEVQKLKQGNMQLTTEARSARAYRDELDVLRERGSRVDRLETELARCKEKLHDVHFYKTRVEELREDNLTLIETKAMLEEQLTLVRSRCDKLHELEKETLHLRSKLHDLEMDRDADKKRLEELMEENMALEISHKQSINESIHLGWELEQLAKSNTPSETRKSFVLELNESASSRLLKLEMENQGLQSTIQELRQASLALHESHVRSLELEKENQGLSKKLEKLQTLLEQEKQATQNVENVAEELRKDKQNLQKTLEAIQADKEREIPELAQEKEKLNHTVSALCDQAQADTEDRMQEVEKEICALHQTISDSGSKVARLEVEQRQSKEVEHLERGHLLQKRLEALAREKCDLQEHKVRMEEEKLGLEHEKAGLMCDKADLMCEKAELEREKAGLEREKAGLEREKTELEREKAGLEQDNRQLKKLADTAQNEAVRLASLEEENEKLQREGHQLRKQADRLELSSTTLSSDNQRLQQAVEEASTYIQELEKKLQEVEIERQGLNVELGVLRASEGTRQLAEQEFVQLEKEWKQLEKEAHRLRQQLEAKEAALEESMLRLDCLEKESNLRDKELSRLQEAASKVKQLQWENKEQQKQATIDKRTLATLREELVNEKLKVQQQWNELEKLNQELEKIGLNCEKLLQEELSADDSKYKILETKFESALKKTLEIREEKIQSLESRLEESTSLNQHLRTELVAVKKSLEALRQRQEEEALSQGSDTYWGKEKWETEQREATAELLKVKDRLIDLEKNNVALQTEKQLQKEQLKKLYSQTSQLNAQILALQKQAVTLQEHNTALHTETAKLQVENSTLGSQSATLTAQNAALQNQVRTLEGEAETLQQQKEEAHSAHERALYDHERLLALHERQASEYEQLIGHHALLKGSQRALEQEHRALQSRYTGLLSQKMTTEELDVTLHRERKSLEEEIKKNTHILNENRSLRGEMERLIQSHEQLKVDHSGLQLQFKELKSTLNGSQLELNRWQARYDQLKEQHQGLDISLTKLDNHCELLTRLKGNLEEENHHLLSQIQMLSQQNQTLLERTMESKELYHEEQKQYIDKLNALRRQKEKLEEKIMDQYKFYDPTPKKRTQWAGAKALAKLIKPKKESSREHIRTAPDMPLSPTPPSEGVDGAPLFIPSLAPPPLPPRQPRRAMEPAGPHVPEERQQRSPGLTPIHSSRGVSDRSSKLRGPHTNGSGEMLLNCRADPGLLSHSPSVAHANTPSQRHRADGLLLVHSDTAFVSGIHGNAEYHPSNGELSHNTSCSSLPINPRGSLERRSASLSSDDRAPSSLLMSPSRCSTLPYDSPTLKAGPQLSRHRSSSPGSEMVTLEEFLQESESHSPPVVQSSSREDLVTDFVRAHHWDGAKAPSSYVAPTVKDTGDVRATKPGQTLRPNVRQPEAGCHAPCRSPTALAFSMSTGSPEGNQEATLGRTRERPMSVAPPPPAQATEARRLSLQHQHTSSLSLSGSAGGTQHRGEVAMVSPVRAAPAARQEEQWQVTPTDSPQIKKQEAGGRSHSAEEQPRAMPSSPDPSRDPQTVWYEYGCV